MPFGGISKRFQWVLGSLFSSLFSSLFPQKLYMERKTVNLKPTEIASERLQMTYKTQDIHRRGQVSRSYSPIL